MNDFDPSPDDPHPAPRPFYDDEAEILERRPPADETPAPYFTRQIPPGPFTREDVVKHATRILELWKRVGCPDDPPMLAIGGAEPVDALDLLDDLGAVDALLAEQAVAPWSDIYGDCLMSDEEFNAMFAPALPTEKPRTMTAYTMAELVERGKNFRRFNA